MRMIIVAIIMGLCIGLFSVAYIADRASKAKLSVMTVTTPKGDRLDR